MYTPIMIAVRLAKRALNPGVVCRSSKRLQPYLRQYVHQRFGEPFRSLSAEGEVPNDGVVGYPSRHRDHLAQARPARRDINTLSEQGRDFF